MEKQNLTTDTHKSNITVGLDIGTTKIVVIVGRKNEYGKIEILGMGKAKSVGVSRGLVSNITDVTNSIKEAVEEAEKSSGYKIGKVFVGIAGQHIRSIQHSDYISRPNTDDVIEEIDLRKLEEQAYRIPVLPGEEIIQVLPQEYKVDSQYTEKPAGMYGNRIEGNFHVIIGQDASIKNIASSIKSAGLELSQLTLEPLASAESVLSDEEKEAGVALIDIGGGTTDLAIIKDGIIRHTAVIPIGGKIITDDIKDACAILEKQAEKLKVKFGSAWPGENKDNEMISIPGISGRSPKEISMKNLSKVIYARVSEIIEMINHEIKIYEQNNHKKRLLAGIVLTGGGSELKHIKQLVEYITGMDTRIGYPNVHLASQSNNELKSPIYATSIGLVMLGTIENGNNYEEELEAGKKISNSTDNIFTEETFVPKQTTDSQPETAEEKKEETPKGRSLTVLRRYFNKIKNFIENAE